MTDCERIRATVRAMIGEGGDAARPDADQIREAYVHVNRCQPCRGEISAEERGRFMYGIALERE